MTKNKELARRLSKTLLSEVPKDKNTLFAVLELLETLSNLYKKEKELRDFLLNPLVPSERKLSYLRALREKMGAPQELDKFFSYLVELNAFPLVSEIKRLYAHELDKILRFSKATLIVASKTEEELIDRIKKLAEKLLGRELDLEVVEDRDIIGGFVIKTYGFVFDASIKSALQNALRN